MRFWNKAAAGDGRENGESRGCHFVTLFAVGMQAAMRGQSGAGGRAANRKCGALYESSGQNVRVRSAGRRGCHFVTPFCVEAGRDINALTSAHRAGHEGRAAA
jgi:hypothetical protein